jgi:hypothetical protein
MFERIGRGGLRMFLAAAAIFVIGAGVAWAAIPGGSGVINGCYEKRTGILRVIDVEAGKRCLSIETPISWSQQGPQGEPGPQGERGVQGEQGLPGERGADGARGPQGEAGPPGATGTPGAQGSVGPKGDTGAQGLQGPPGANGRDGAQGPRGDIGPQGPAGPPGPVTRFEERIVKGTGGRVVVKCSQGESVVGGGHVLAAGDPARYHVSSNRPVRFLTGISGWEISYEYEAFDPKDPAVEVYAFAICASSG